MSVLRIPILVCTALLAGCISLGSGPRELSVWSLESRARPVDGNPVTWQLVVDEPVADDAVSGTRILVAPSGAELGVLRGARWNDEAPALMQTLLVRGFEDSGRIAGVGRTSESVRGDLALISELRVFQTERAVKGERARVVLAAKLVRYATNDVLAAQLFEAAEPVEGRGTAGVVTAFQRATDAIVPQVVAWTLAAGEANLAADGPRAR